MATGDAETSAAVRRGRKLLRLCQSGEGGEQRNAGRLLAAHLRAHDLTLYDLDAGFPVTQDVADVAHWREAASLVAKLGTDLQDDALNRLVDMNDLTQPELKRVLAALDWQALASLRAGVWAQAAGVPEADYLSALSDITEADLLASASSGSGGSPAARLQTALNRAYTRRHCPERLIRTADEVETAFVLGAAEALAGPHAEARADAEGVRAYLSAPELARLRAAIANHAAGAQEAAQAAAREFGRSLR